MHDVFISYPAEAKATADAACAMLEGNGIRCWIAPRDVLPGSDWSESIVDAIQKSRLMVLIFDQNANESQHIKREVERAVDANIPIIPVRIENVAPSKGLSYFISSPHWLDALTPPLEKHLQHLVDTTRQILGTSSAPAGPARPIEYQPPARASRRVMPGIFMGSLLACVLIAGYIGIFYIRKQVANSVATPAPATQSAAQPPAAPVDEKAGPSRSSLRVHLERFVGELEQLDKKAAMVGGNGLEVQLYRQTMRVLAASQIDPETAENLAAQLSETPLYSMVSLSGHGGRDETFMEFGATAEHVAAFRDMVPVMQDTGRRTGAAVREVAALRQIDRWRSRYAPSLAGLPDSYGDALLAVYCRGFVQVATLSHLAAVRVIGDLSTHAESQWPRLQLFSTLPRIDMKQYSEPAINQFATNVNEMWEETRQQSLALAAARQQLIEQVIASWCGDTEPAARPTASEPMESAIEKSRALRAAGKPGQADAVLLCVAVMFQSSDRHAMTYVDSALSYHRSGLPGGLLICGADNRTEDWSIGLQDGAVLISYNGTPVNTPSELTEAMRAAPADQGVRFEFGYRDDTGAWKKQTGTRRRNGPIDATLLPI